MSNLVILATNLNIENLITGFLVQAFGGSAEGKSSEAEKAVKVYRHKIRDKYPTSSQPLIEKIRSLGYNVSITESLRTILPSDRVTDVFIISDEYSSPRGVYYDAMALPVPADRIRFYRVVIKEKD